MTESEVIDIQLESIQKMGIEFGRLDIPNDMRQSAFTKLVAYGLVVNTGNGIQISYRLSQKGYEVLEAGGFDKWVAYNRRIADEVHKATLDSSASAKQSKNAAWVAGVAAIVSAVIGIYQAIGDNKRDADIKNLTMSIKRVDSISNNQQSTKQKEIREIQSSHSLKKTPARPTGHL